jgi:signal transduction histidine kinase/CheY-like chemotaxis protein/CHASE3 domain sensor protein
MKLHDLKIATQLRVALGLILLLVLAIGGVAWRQTNLLWVQTQTLYEHPFQVVSAVGELEADILTIHQSMQSLLLDPNEQSVASTLQEIEVHSVNASARFQTLFEKYLGPREDIIRLQDEFAAWKVIRDESVRLLRAGKLEEAKERALRGVEYQQVAALIRHIQYVERFAGSKGRSFYQIADEEHVAQKRNLALVFAGVLSLSLVVGLLLLKSIKSPLMDLTAATRLFRKGHLDERSPYVSANEFGVLSSSFNTMADEIQALTEINEHAASLGEVMLRENDIHAFCLDVLQGLLEYTGSQVGAVYFQNEAKTAFVHFESIGLTGGGRAAFSATDFEGEMGAVLTTRQIQHLSEISADTRFTFAAVTGDFAPRAILTIPVVSENSVVAVISLASIRDYDDSALQLVHKIWSVLTARVNGVLAFRKIHYFADQLEHQNNELETQKRELAAQANELIEQNGELEIQKQQLHEANRLKSAFLSNMSHELRTPLNSVIALSGVLGRRLAHTIPTEEYGYLEVIERNGKNLLALINNILDLSRIEAGREDLNISRFSVAEWIHATLSILEPLAREKSLDLRKQVADDLPPLASDYDKCHHILQNLVGNALKFTESGTVEVSASQVGRDLHVTVRDTGIGIDAQHLPHIFDEFRQADNSTSRKFGGSGLGLAIARSYAQQLGGNILVESTPGRGSTFTLRLPQTHSALLEISPQQATPTPPEPTPGPAPIGHGQTLLIVEDSEAAIIQLTDILQNQGYQIKVAHNGNEALDHIGQCLPDAMILDLMMPEVDGFDVLKAIRSEERSALLPVLILTAKHVSREELSFLKGNHIYQLIQKGDINKAGLLAAVAQMVATDEPASATEPASTPPITPSTARRRPTRPGKPRILVVEDNPDNRHTARALLSAHYQVIDAADGRAAIEQARLHQPDLILTDIALPVMDGFEVLLAIRQDPKLCDIPVLALTASAMKGNREEILAHGFDGYVSKPIDHDTLMNALHGFLG